METGKDGEPYEKKENSHICGYGEKTLLLHSLVELKNQLIKPDRYTIRPLS